MMMKIFRNIFDNQKGYALPAALVVLLLGSLIIVPSLALMNTSLNKNRVIDEEDMSIYAADAGIQYALWHMQPEYEGDFELPEEGEEESLDFPEVLNNRSVYVTISNEGEQLYEVTSLSVNSEGETKEIKSYVSLIPASDGTKGLFDYAASSLDGDIKLTGSSLIKSDPLGDGDVYANGGDVILTGSSVIDGDATATGDIDYPGWHTGAITGVKTPYDTNPPDPPEIDIDGYINETLAYSCDDIPDAVSSWSNPAGEYLDPIRVIVDMQISGTGTWTFYDRVCIGRDLKISGSTEVIFKGPVSVGRDVQITGTGTVTFENTLYVDDDLSLSGSRTINLLNTVYVGDKVQMSGATLTGGTTLVAGGDIQLSGSGKFTNVDDIPFVVSQNGDITFSGASAISAIVYAMTGEIKMTGSTCLYGCAIGTDVSLTGASVIEYPVDIGDRDDLPDSGGVATNGGIDILTYTIN
jgi:hypothetical protein